jgi:hypothetical protein
MGIIYRLPQICKQHAASVAPDGVTIAERLLSDYGDTLSDVEWLWCGRCYRDAVEHDIPTSDAEAATLQALLWRASARSGR